MVTIISTMLRTDAPHAVIIIRIMVGAVFISEGIQKFLIPETVGAGRFARIGLPAPEFLAPFVGVFEIICGLLVLAGLFTRFAVIPLIIIMFVAIASTKIPTLMEEGFWSMAHASRNDWSMLLGSLFLLVMGGGKSSLDFRIWDGGKE